jgi:hypothetical protein
VKWGEYDNGLSYEDEVSGVGVYLEAINARRWATKSGWIVSPNHVCMSRVVGNVFENPELPER